VEVLRRKPIKRYDNSREVGTIIKWLDGSYYIPINDYEYDHDAERDIVSLCKAGEILHIEDVIMPNWFVV
jgi:hypothetical protein